MSIDNNVDEERLNSTKELYEVIKLNWYLFHSENTKHILDDNFEKDLYTVINNKTNMPMCNRYADIMLMISRCDSLYDIEHKFPDIYGYINIRHKHVFDGIMHAPFDFIINFKTYSIYSLADYYRSDKSYDEYDETLKAFANNYSKIFEWCRQNGLLVEDLPGITKINPCFYDTITNSYLIKGDKKGIK